MGMKPIEMEWNGTKYAWCQPPGPGHIYYDFQEHVTVASRVITSALIASNIMPPHLQDVTSVILTSTDVNIAYRNGMPVLKSRWGRIAWDQYITSPLTGGYAGSSVRLLNEARVMQHISCTDSEVDELTKVLHNKDVKPVNFGEEAEELSFIFDGRSHAFFMSVTRQFMFFFYRENNSTGGQDPRDADQKSGGLNV